MKNGILGLRLFLNTFGEYSDNYLFDDMEVNDCLMKMYFYLLSGKEEDFSEFEVLYDKLSEEQKKIVKNDYIYIMESRDSKVLSLNKRYNK